MNPRALIVLLLLTLAIAGVTTVGARQGPPDNAASNGRGGLAVNWMSERLVIDTYPGATHQETVTFSVSRRLSDISVRIVPSLEEMIVPGPKGFDGLVPGTEYQLDLTVGIPQSAEPNTSYDGTLHLRHRRGTLARPLPIEIVVDERPRPTLHTLTMEQPSGEGSVDPVPGEHAYPDETIVDLQAEPDPGWDFDRWMFDGEPGPETLTTTIAMDGDVTAQAVFAERPPVQMLDPAGSVSFVDGVTFGAPEGALDEAVDVEIVRTGDPPADAPLPVGWTEGEMQIVGGFYEVSSSRDVSTPSGNYLAIGLPVPEGVSTDNLAFAVLSPPGSVIAHGTLDPSMRWHTERGQYDDESGLFGTTVPFVGTEPRVYALVDGASYSDVSAPEGVSLSSMDLLAEQEFGGFQIECVNNFTINPCTEQHRERTAAALSQAYTTWVEDLGFDQPHLQHTLVDIEFAPGATPTVTVAVQYDYLLSFHDSPNGSYSIEDGIGVTYFPSDDEFPDPDDLISRHELFHALQYGYAETFDNRKERRAGVVEGVATAAEMSMQGLTRSNRADFPGRDPRGVDVAILRGTQSADVEAYEMQDFWVYLGRRLSGVDPQISFLIPFFEQGSQPDNLNQMLAYEGTIDSLSDAYWQWARNQSFEKTQTLGPDEDGAPVPSGQSCAWSGHGEAEAMNVSSSFQSFALYFNLEPLSSEVFEIHLQPGADPYALRTAVDSSEAQNENVRVKFYLEDDAGTGDCVDRSESNEHTFDVDDTEQTFYILVSNTDDTSSATDIELEFTVLEDRILRAPDGNRAAHFGASAAATSEHYVIGAPGHGSGFGTGKVYLFDASGTYVRGITAPNAQDRARFGDAVAAMGDNFLVGAPGHDPGPGLGTGLAYLFDADGNVLQTFSAPGPQSGARFGEAVAAVGDKVLIGAGSHETDAGTSAGQAYLFESDGTHLHTFTAPDVSVSDGFGTSLAVVDEDQFVIGSRHHEVYLFDLNGNHLRTYNDPEAPALTRFGSAVASLNGNVLIGAWQSQLSPGFDTGRVYVFDTSGTLLQAITAPDPQEEARFGGAVAAAGDYIVVGEPSREIDELNLVGQAYLFDVDGNHLQTFRAPDAQYFASFGASVAGMPGSALVGAMNHDTSAGDAAGQAYLFSVSE